MTEGDLLGLLNQIKDSWPQFQISKENLLHPTMDLVVRFYSKFVTEYYEKIAYLTRSEVVDDVNASDLAPELHLFQQVSKILAGIMNSLKFTLLDIYQPTPKRTKSFFTVCIHFIQFVDYSTDEIYVLGNGIFKMKEETDKLTSELSDLLQETNEYATTKAELSEYIKNSLEQEHKAVKNAQKEMLDMKAMKEKSQAEKKVEIERLKLELENEEIDLSRLNSREKELLQQRVTESEYRNIICALENVKTVSETLESDDVNIGDGLLLENEVLVHSSNCKRVLSKYDFNLKEVNALINKEIEIKTILNRIEKLQTDKVILNQQTLKYNQNLAEISDSFSAIQKDYKELKENVISKLEQFSKDMAVARGDVEGRFQNNTRTISEHNDAIMKLEEDLEKLKITLRYEYTRVCNAEKRVIDKFKNTLKKYAKLV